MFSEEIVWAFPSCLTEVSLRITWDKKVTFKWVYYKYALMLWKIEVLPYVLNDDAIDVL